MHTPQQDPPWLTPTDALSRFHMPAVVGSSESTADEVERFGFRIGALGFLAETGLYCEVVEQARIYPLPATPQWFSGLLNLRGVPAPVLDLRVLWGDAPADPKHARLLAVGRGEQAAVLWIDALPERHAAPSQPVKQLPALPRIVREHIGHGYFYHGRIWLEVRFGALFQVLAGRSDRADGE